MQITTTAERPIPTTLARCRLRVDSAPAWLPVLPTIAYDRHLQPSALRRASRESARAEQDTMLEAEHREHLLPGRMRWPHCAAANPRASAIPPAAMTGTVTASTTCGRRATRPTICCSASSSRKAPRCPPASIPCATIASAPASSAAFASVTVVAFANHRIPRAFSSDTKAGA
jgi:hypothetical protein